MPRVIQVRLHRVLLLTHLYCSFVDTLQVVASWGWPDERQSWTWPVAQGTSFSVNVYSRYPTVRQSSCFRHANPPFRCVGFVAFTLAFLFFSPPDPEAFWFLLSPPIQIQSCYLAVLRTEPGYRTQMCRPFLSPLTTACDVWPRAWLGRPRTQRQARWQRHRPNQVRTATQIALNSATS